MAYDNPFNWTWKCVPFLVMENTHLLFVSPLVILRGKNFLCLSTRNYISLDFKVSVDSTIFELHNFVAIIRQIHFYGHARESSGIVRPKKVTIISLLE